MICEKCGEDKKLLHHHEKYLELHGEEKIIMLCKSCHVKLHLNLRKNGKCNIPVDELRKISHNSNFQTNKNEEFKTFHNYNNKKYRIKHKEEISIYNREYRIKHKEEIHLSQCRLRKANKLYGE